VLALALVAGCGGDADAPGDGPPGPAANATQSTLLRASADSPSAAATGTATATATATATPVPASTAPPLVIRTPVPGCAQDATAPPAIYYGFGLAEGEVVMVFNTRPGCEQVVCEETEVDGDNVCGPREGDAMVFTIDGEPAGVSETWSAGLAPTDVQRGISLRPERLTSAGESVKHQRDTQVSSATPIACQAPPQPTHHHHQARGCRWRQ
jgi:hypothetical protein